MEVLIPILMMAIPVILAVIAKKAQTKVKVQKVYPDILEQIREALGDYNADGQMPGDLPDGPETDQAGKAVQKTSWEGSDAHAGSQAAVRVKSGPETAAGTDPGSSTEDRIVFSDEEKRKLIVYSEILKPKFED